MITIETNHGKILIELDEKNTPKTADNFIRYIEEGFYGRFYIDKTSFLQMFEDYFSDCNGGWEQILCVDMKEMKCYLLDKEVKYPQKEVEIK